MNELIIIAITTIFTKKLRLPSQSISQCAKSCQFYPSRKKFYVEVTHLRKARQGDDSMQFQLVTHTVHSHEQNS